MATTLTDRTDTTELPARQSRFGLDMQGITPKGEVFWNLTPAELVEHAVRRGEGKLVEGGPFDAVTAPHTGRSPNDRFIVKEPSSEANVDWNSKFNTPISPEHYQALRADVVEYLGEQNLYVRDMWAGADEAHRLAVRLVTPNAWQNLFARNMFRRPEPQELAEMEPGFTILHAPEFQADPARHGTRTGTFILVNIAAKEVLIGGTRYAGEIKKSVFGVLNYLLPGEGVFPMHCSANIGPEGDTALFFGLSGTGKTTLSADPSRSLIGDDEHGWGEHGVFNFEGGCYAKVIKLSPEGEPEIFATTRMFGTVLENVVLDENRRPDFDSAEITENTRACYPLEYIPNHVPSGRGGHPKNVVFLTADAYGVMPPIAKLTPEQAMYHFLSGYTAKVAGTERGVTEPQATFSTCFGAPFMVRSPATYAEMLGARLAEHGSRVWLINTGWTGGPYGVGSRMKLSYTRAMVRAALAGELDEVETVTDAVFGLEIPVSVPGVPSEVLRPRDTWSNGAEYDAQAAELARLFAKNFEKFSAGVSEAVRNAGPHVD